MYLTEYEKGLLAGTYGQGKKIAMDIVCEMGRMYGAKRLLPAMSAHIDGCAFSTVGIAGIEFTEKLVRAGARVAIPSTLNISARDIAHWAELRCPPDYAENSRRLEQAYLDMGCTPTWTCAPYLTGSSPSFGQHVAWSESNAVNFVNSVLGARTNRYPDLVDICCAIVGLVPEFGLHLTENRKGQFLFSLSGFGADAFSDSADFALLGYFIGKETGNSIPVIDGLPETATHDQLKSLSAAAAASGSVGLFHAVGITPEAGTMADAFQGGTPEKTFSVTPDTLAECKKALTGATDPHVGLVLIGCPHASYRDIEEIFALLAGRHVAKETEFWIQTAAATENLAQRSGLAEKMEALGVRFVPDTCINNTPMAGWGFKTIVTNSGKMGHYAPGTTGAGLVFLSTAACVDAAVRGEVAL